MMRSPVGQLFHKQKKKVHSFLVALDPSPFGNVPNETVSEKDAEIVELRTKMQNFCVFENEESYSSILHSAYYFNVAYKKTLIFYISQCNSVDAYNALMDNVEEEMGSIARDQEMYAVNMASCISDNPHQFSSHLRCLIEATRKRLTLIEFFYYFSIIKDQDSDDRYIMKECAADVGHCLNYISNFLTSTHFTAVIYKDCEQGVLLIRSISSMYESLRHSKFLSNVKEVDTYCLRSVNFLNALCTSYLFSYNKLAQILLMKSCFKHLDTEEASPLDLAYMQHMLTHCKSAINHDYFQQISGEYLQSELILQEMIRESAQKACLFKQEVKYANTHSDMASVALDANEAVLSTWHLKKVLYHIKQAIESLFDNEEISIEGQTCINLLDDTITLPLVEEGLPRIRELEQRVIIMERTLKDQSGYISMVKKQIVLTDAELKEIVNQLDKELATQLVTLSQKKRELKARELKWHKSAVVSAEPLAPIVIKLKKQKAPIRQRSHAESVSSFASVIPLPVSNPPVTYMAPMPINPLPAPTVHISKEEQSRDKEFKTQKYLNSITKYSLVCQETKKDNLPEEKEEFLCEYAVYGNPVKARLDYDACREAMGDQLFDEAIPKLNAILQRARKTGLYGQGIKQVGGSEKRVLKRMNLLDPAFSGLVFKLKPTGDYGDKIRVYGKVVARDGGLELVFDTPIVGNVHKKIARRNKSIRM